MIPKFSTYIKESIWSDIQKRSYGEIERKEDTFNPEYVDFGENTTVYWTVENLIIDNNAKFHFNDVKDYNNNGWRLPTVEEVKQINWTGIRKSWYDDCWHIKFQDENELKLYTLGNGGSHMWTSEINKKFPTCAWSYGFDNSLKFDIDSFNININRLYVFLVKDKKHINESIWSDIQKRSSGDTERKEDIINSNVKEMIPVDIGVSVLWADKDLSIDDEIYLYIDQVKNFEKDGWRLPTKNEADELLTKVKWTTTKWTTKKNSQGVFNRFYKIGMTHIPNAPEENIIYFNCEIPKEAEYWESKSVKNTPDGYWETFSFKNDGSFLPHSAHSISKITDKCRVRLVREK